MNSEFCFTSVRSSSANIEIWFSSIAFKQTHNALKYDLLFRKAESERQHRVTGLILTYNTLLGDVNSYNIKCRDHATFMNCNVGLSEAN